MPHLVRFMMLFAAAILVAMVGMCFGGGGVPRRAHSAEVPPTKPAPAKAAPGTMIRCRAEYQQICTDKRCRLDTQAVAVELTFDRAIGSGELCTFTYCRGFVLLRYRQAAPGGAVVSGLVVSAKSGSTKPRSERPEIGMLLTIDFASRRFGLTDGSARGMHGWFGACRPGNR
jgi:hypothetical protein